MIYFDNAATSFPKPRAVIDEVCRCMTQYCGNPGRGAHRLSLAASEKVFECRALAAEMFGLNDESGVIFTLNTTHALNIALKGLMHRGSHAIISDMEHNSVYRVIRKYADIGLYSYDVFDSLCLCSERSAERICRSIEALVRDETELIVCAHASNICSAALPIGEIGLLCRELNRKRLAKGLPRIYFVVDAAASAGHIPISIRDMGIDALAVPSHKGLYGPQGCGMLLLNDILPDTLLEGGNGVSSSDPDMGYELPERYEAGTVPTPAIAGLCEGMKFVRSVGVEKIALHECELFKLARKMLATIPSVQTYGAEHIGATLSFNLYNLSADDLGRRLDRYGICVRSGHHCAPLAHSTLGTPRDGAVRLSFGYFNTAGEVMYLIQRLSQIAAQATATP